MSVKPTLTGQRFGLIALAIGLSLSSLGVFLVFRRNSAKSIPAGQQTSLFQITSNSMAPALVGPHYSAECQQCQHTWMIAAETLNIPQAVICPSCGSSRCETGQISPGNIVRMSSSKHWHAATTIRRLDCVVFTDGHPLDSNPPDQPSRAGARSWTCKRVWGLPGEEVDLRDGQLWVNGSLYQKSLYQLKKLAIPVSDFPFDSTIHWQLHKPGVPTDATPPRSEFTLETGWQLNWNYRSIYHLPSQAKLPQPVLDDYSCNHSTSQSLMPVDDLLLTIDFEGLGTTSAQRGISGKVIIQCNYQGESSTVECRFGIRVESDVHSSSLVAWNPKRLHVGGWDGQVWAQWDQEPERLLTRIDLTPPSVAPATLSGVGTTRFTIRAEEGAVRISRLRVERDLYLRIDDRAQPNGVPEPTELGLDEYYVIGDNLPISRDSRNGLGNIRHRQMIGILDHLPGR